MSKILNNENQLAERAQELENLQGENQNLMGRITELEASLGTTSAERDSLREEVSRLQDSERNFETAVAKKVCELGISKSSLSPRADGSRAPTLTEEARAVAGSV